MLPDILFSYAGGRSLRRSLNVDISVRKTVRSLQDAQPQEEESTGPVLLKIKWNNSCRLCIGGERKNFQLLVVLMVKWYKVEIPDFIVHKCRLKIRDKLVMIM